MNVKPGDGDSPSHPGRGCVLAGKGIAALQEAGWLSVQRIAFPRMAPLGLYPTLQGVALQVLVVGVILAGFWFNRRAARHAVVPN